MKTDWREFFKRFGRTIPEAYRTPPGFVITEIEIENIYQAFSARKDEEDKEKEEALYQRIKARLIEEVKVIVEDTPYFGRLKDESQEDK